MTAPDIADARCSTCGFRRNRLYDGPTHVAWQCPNCCEVTPLEENQ